MEKHDTRTSFSIYEINATNPLHAFSPAGTIETFDRASMSLLLIGEVYLSVEFCATSMATVSGWNVFDERLDKGMLRRREKKRLHLAVVGKGLTRSRLLPVRK